MNVRQLMAELRSLTVANPEYEDAELSLDDSSKTVIGVVMKTSTHSCQTCGHMHDGPRRAILTTDIDWDDC